LAKLKRWYDRQAALAVHVVKTSDDEYESYASRRYKHPRTLPGLWECLVYPLRDGSGIGLLIFLPPLLWLLTLPIFDIIAVLQPIDKSHWALGLLVVPVIVPMIFSFMMIFGYVLLFLGYVLVSSSLGENDHPRWPEWHPSDIAEGVGRWFWAACIGLSIALAPIGLYLLRRHELGWLDWVILGELGVVGGGYAVTALAASLLHENIIAANPVTVIAAIAQIGWAFLKPSLVAGCTLAFAALGVWVLLYHVPTPRLEALGLWVYWVVLLYLAMVVMRIMGLTYHARALDLHWFRKPPRWATTRHHGHIYANS